MKIDINRIEEMNNLLKHTSGNLKYDESFTLEDLNNYTKYGPMWSMNYISSVVWLTDNEINDEIYDIIVNNSNDLQEMADKAIYTSTILYNEKNIMDKKLCNDKKMTKETLNEYIIMFKLMQNIKYTHTGVNRWNTFKYIDIKLYEDMFKMLDDLESYLNSELTKDELFSNNKIYLLGDKINTLLVMGYLWNSIEWGLNNEALRIIEVLNKYLEHIETTMLNVERNDYDVVFEENDLGILYTISEYDSYPRVRMSVNIAHAKLQYSLNNDTTAMKLYEEIYSLYSKDIDKYKHIDNCLGQNRIIESLVEQWLIEDDENKKIIYKDRIEDILFNLYNVELKSAFNEFLYESLIILYLLKETIYKDIK